METPPFRSPKKQWKLTGQRGRNSEVLNLRHGLVSQHLRDRSLRRTAQRQLGKARPRHLTHCRGRRSRVGVDMYRPCQRCRGRWRHWGLSRGVHPAVFLPSRCHRVGCGRRRDSTRSSAVVVVEVRCVSSSSAATTTARLAFEVATPPTAVTTATSPLARSSALGSAAVTVTSPTSTA